MRRLGYVRLRILSDIGIYFHQNVLQGIDEKMENWLYFVMDVN